MAVIRSWQCLNTRRCGSTFDSWDANPECPQCRGVRVSWIPGGGHIAGTSRTCDADLRALADCFSLTDMNSASTDRGAKKIKAPPPAQAAPLHTFAPGFSAPVDMRQGAVCVPSSSAIKPVAKVGIGQSFAPNKSFPNVRSNTAIEASHKS
jgi:hypothetical protein